jgi:hypothetical protein
MLSEAAEKSNVQVTNAMLDLLFYNRQLLAKRAFEQLDKNFANKIHYGRNVRLGMSADEAGKKIRGE